MNHLLYQILASQVRHHPLHYNTDHQAPCPFWFSGVLLHIFVYKLSLNIIYIVILCCLFFTLSMQIVYILNLWEHSGFVYVATVTVKVSTVWGSTFSIFCKVDLMVIISLTLLLLFGCLRMSLFPLLIILFHFILKAEIPRETDTERDLHCSIPHTPARARIGPSKSPEPRTQCRFPIWVTGIHTLQLPLELPSRLFTRNL